MINQYIIAGNIQQYHDYCTKQTAYYDRGSYLMFDNNIRLKYVLSQESLIGIPKPKGKLIGTWYNRQDIHEILGRLMTQGSFDSNKYDEILVQRNLILGINPDLSDFISTLKKGGTPFIQP
jgi:hypothetical protein